MATLELNGQTHILAFRPWTVIKRLHKERGIDLLELLDDEKAADRMGEPETMSGLLWGALIHGQPDLTIEQVDGWLGLDNVGRVAAAIAEAIKEAMTGPGVSANPTT